MAIYDYKCEKCEKVYEVVKPMAEYKSEEKCPKCGNVATKLLNSKVHFTGTKIEDAEWNPGLGAITKSKRHREELVKRKNLIEIGNEKVDTVHKVFDTAREEKRKKSWDDIL